MLSAVSEAEYGMYVRIFLTYKVASPTSLLVPNYVSAFVQQFLSVPLRPYPEVDKIVTNLVEQKADIALNAFIPALEHADSAALQAIVKFCKGNKAVSADFQTALQAQLKRGKGGASTPSPSSGNAKSPASTQSAQSTKSSEGSGSGSGSIFQRLLGKLPGKK